jgi:pantoate--beta-alanine ligase
MTTQAATTPTTPTVVRTVGDLRDAVVAIRAGGRQVALVPTMGALHDGHLSLMRLAGVDDHAVVMSLFVNPTQFAPTEDLSAYPRDEARDLQLAADAGTELVFAPRVDEIYPDGFGTTITVDGPTRVLEVAVIRRLVRDLHLDDMDLVIGSIVRESDGLAMSSRNAYLGHEDRAAALVLRRALDAALDAVATGVTSPARIEQVALDVLTAEPRCTPEYARIVHPDTFTFPDDLNGPALLCVAARVGPARLIDNQFLNPA